MIEPMVHNRLQRSSRTSGGAPHHPAGRPTTAPRASSGRHPPRRGQPDDAAERDQRRHAAAGDQREERAADHEVARDLVRDSEPHTSITVDALGRPAAGTARGITSTLSTRGGSAANATVSATYGSSARARAILASWIRPAP